MINNHRNKKAMQIIGPDVYEMPALEYQFYLYQRKQYVSFDF